MFSNYVDDYITEYLKKLEHTLSNSEIYAMLIISVNLLFKKTKMK